MKTKKKTKFEQRKRELAVLRLSVPDPVGPAATEPPPSFAELLKEDDDGR